LRDIEDLSYEEIAEVMQVSLGTVKSRLVRGREALKKRLQPYIEKAGKELGFGARKPTAGNEPAGALEAIG
jgi:RNA polymerase sigma-70 factor, ECF subfamily